MDTMTAHFIVFMLLTVAVIWCLCDKRITRLELLAVMIAEVAFVVGSIMMAYHNV